MFNSSLKYFSNIYLCHIRIPHFSTLKKVRSLSYTDNYVSYFSTQKIWCWYSKEQSQWDHSFEHLKHYYLTTKAFFDTPESCLIEMVLFSSHNTVLNWVFTLEKCIYLDCCSRGHYKEGTFPYYLHKLQPLFDTFLMSLLRQWLGH